METQESKSILLKIIFLTALIGLVIVHLVFNFKGLTSKHGIDQAQMGRQIAEGEGVTTQFIKPFAIQQLEEANIPVNFYKFKDTSHSPLNPLIYAGVIKLFGGDNPEKFAMSKNDYIYELDRIIAGICMLFFILSIGINYLLVSNIFDSKIASMVAILMLVSNRFWEFSQSGLPQMLMLFLFSGACYFLWKGIQRQEAELSPKLPVVLSGFIFGLLALAHWLTLWIFLGYMIFCVAYFKPRGMIAGAVALIVCLFIAGPLLFNANNSDGVMGTAYYYINGSTGFAQDYQFRQLNLPSMNVRDLISRVAKTSLLQANNIHNHIGGFFLATGFFLALLHPFKRTSIAIFRWCILIMWVFAVVGMSLYGLSNQALDPNQLHILFMPMMSAFALALVSILWARISLSQNGGIFKQAPFVIIIIISVTPLIIFAQSQFKMRQVKTVPGYSPYTLNQVLTKHVNKDEIVFTDQPWAVAWYANRTAIWLPTERKELEKIEGIATKTNANIVGIFITPNIRDEGQGTTFQGYRDLSPLAYNLLGFQLGGTGFAERHPGTAPLISPTSGRYAYRIPITEDPLNRVTDFIFTLYSKIDPTTRAEQTNNS